MSSTYDQLAAEYSSLPSFTPFLSPTTLKPLSVFCLSLAFIASFYFSTLRSKSSLPLSEVAIGSVASILGGFGLVLGFCAVGVCV
ncbi:OST5 family protein [Sporobolomyces salmoneus]|uniref:OST5 family protein n=1 Tax=Sporobolomyces salmoneus TaxID=183962 RepID=UPI00317F97DC